MLQIHLVIDDIQRHQRLYTMQQRLLCHPKLHSAHILLVISQLKHPISIILMPEYEWQVPAHHVISLQNDHHLHVHHHRCVIDWVIVYEDKHPIQLV